MGDTMSARYWHEADMGYCTANVRYWGKSGQVRAPRHFTRTDRRCDVVVYAGFGEPI